MDATKYIISLALWSITKRGKKLQKKKQKKQKKKLILYYHLGMEVCTSWVYESLKHDLWQKSVKWNLYLYL